MAKIPQVYIIKKTRRGKETFVQGTVSNLTNYFSYTLECGNSWNKKISRSPKTITSLVNNINNSYSETQAGCYNRDYVDLVESIPKGARISLA